MLCPQDLHRYTSTICALPSTSSAVCGGLLPELSVLLLPQPSHAGLFTWRPEIPDFRDLHMLTCNCNVHSGIGAGLNFR